MYLTASELEFYHQYCSACKRKVTLRDLAREQNVSIDFLKRKIKTIGSKVGEISLIKTRKAMPWPKIKNGFIPHGNNKPKRSIGVREIDFDELERIGNSNETIHQINGKS